MTQNSDDTVQWPPTMDGIVSEMVEQLELEEKEEELEEVREGWNEEEKEMNEMDDVMVEKDEANNQSWCPSATSTPRKGRLKNDSMAGSDTNIESGGETEEWASQPNKIKSGAGAGAACRTICEEACCTAFTAGGDRARQLPPLVGRGGRQRLQHRARSQPQPQQDS